MAEQLFAVDAHNLIKLQKFYKKTPKQFNRVFLSEVTGTGNFVINDEVQVVSKSG